MSKASRFFAAESSSSDSESEAEIKVSNIRKSIIQHIESSDDEDKVKRFVRSQKEKKFEELSNISKKIRNSLKIKDFDIVCTEFDALHKAILKLQQAAIQNQTPKMAIKLLTEIEDLSKTVWDDKEAKSKLNKTNLKALTTLRQKIKKSNKVYEAEIVKCRENPQDYEEVEVLEDEKVQSDDVDDDDMDEFSNNKFKKTFKSDSDDESSQSDSHENEKGSASQSSRPTGANLFLKSDKNQKTAPKRRDRKDKEVRSKKKIDDLDNENGEVTIPKQVTKRSAKDMFSNDDAITLENVVKKMREINKLRGKKLSDRMILNTYQDLKSICEEYNFGAAVTLKLQLHVILHQLDSTTADFILKLDTWKSILVNFHQFLLHLTNNYDVDIKENVMEESESFVKPYLINGSPLYILIRIKDELTKILQNTDCYSTEYITRMKDVATLGEFVAMLQSYIEKKGAVTEICDVYLLRIEQIYYKLDASYLTSLKHQLSESLLIESDESAKVNLDNQISDRELMNSLCSYIYKNGDQRVCSRAALCQVYHHCIHDRWNEAKQLFLMCRIYETIYYADIVTHILYNRVLVQLGLCAFRQGLLHDAYNALRDIQLSGRSKELLAQGLIIKNIERSPKQEMKERRQLLPFHMHINLELVECVYLTCILLLEGAYSVAPMQDARNKHSSRGMIYLIRNAEKQIISGPPEWMRDNIYAAFKALKIGDWKNCLKFISNIKCWKLFVHAKKVMEMLEDKIRRACLIAFLFAHCHVYTKIKLSFLTEIFQLSTTDVHTAVNKIIINDNFFARWNDDGSLLIINQSLLSNPAHFLCTTVVDKLSILMEHQEKIIELKHTINSVKDRLGAVSI